MKLSIKAGSTSQTVNIFIRDVTSTSVGLTGLVYNSAGLTAYYALPKAAATAITLATLAAVTTAWSSGGFKEIDATNMPGWYRLDIPDAALASGRFVSLHLQGATNMVPCPVEIELTGWDNQDAVRGGMTALPNANAGANGGLPTGNASGQVVMASTATGAITSGSFAAGAIDNAAIATDAIGSAELATSAVTEIQSGLALATDLSTASGNITAIKAKTDNLPSDPADASDIAASFSTVNSTLGTISSYIDTEVAAIKAKTDNLPPDPADASDIAGSFATINTKLDTVAGYIDTEVAAIKAKTDNLPSDPADQSLIMDAIAGISIPTANQNADALLDRADALETGWTLRKALRIVLAVLGGKASGMATTTAVFRNVTDSKDRVTATVDDDGNRTAVTLDAS